MERRRHPRIPYELTVDVTSEDGVLIARVVDISEGGVFIATSEPLPIGSACQLDVDLGFRVVSVNGEVAWIKSDHAGQPGMGIRFCYASQSAREALRLFVALQVYEDEPLEVHRRPPRLSLWH
ncbi:MAG: TIGR02266 family protein [Myxococcales bacterium]|nr:TIGR02266 family protein [Myxococcales bacterium]